MDKKSTIIRLRISCREKHNLDSIKKYGVNPSEFIREAIKEKIAKDFKIIENRHKSNLNLTRPPF